MHEIIVSNLLKADSKFEKGKLSYHAEPVSTSLKATDITREIVNGELVMVSLLVFQSGLCTTSRSRYVYRSNVNNFFFRYNKRSLFSDFRQCNVAMLYASDTSKRNKLNTCGEKKLTIRYYHFLFCTLLMSFKILEP